MNKTIVACVGIITTGLVLICVYAKKTETRDRLTVCIDTVMTKSIEAKQPINAKDAREICG